MYQPLCPAIRFHFSFRLNFLRRIVASRVEDDAGQLKLVIFVVLGKLAHQSHQQRQSDRRKILRLHGDHDEVAYEIRGSREKRFGRCAIDEDEVILSLELSTTVSLNNRAADGHTLANAVVAPRPTPRL